MEQVQCSLCKEVVSIQEKEQHVVKKHSKSKVGSLFRYFIFLGNKNTMDSSEFY